MNLSLVRLTEKPALYLPEADELIKRQPLWGGAFIHLFIYFHPEPDLHQSCLRNVQPPGHDKLSEALVSIFTSLEGKKDLPEYPGRQTHSKPPRVLIQIPSFRQGESSHSFTSRSHSVPKYPGGHTHRNLGKVWQHLIRRKRQYRRARWQRGWNPLKTLNLTAQN